MTIPPSPKPQTTRFQGPKGTRDFYPAEMNWRRYLQDAFRAVSIRHGFDEIEGPMFESLDLYKVKSGDGIVSELFSFEDRGGRQSALRPEFTPTLARMVVSKAAALPKPIKWFAIPAHFRAERPQRGRLREFLQWNVDFVGDATTTADTEVLGVAIDLLAELGLTREIVRVRLSHRATISKLLIKLGLTAEQLPPAFALLDKRDKITAEEFQKQAQTLGLTKATIQQFDELARINVSAEKDWESIAAIFDQCADETAPTDDNNEDALADLRDLHRALNETGLAPWCDFDLGIVRGLAYYTGMVFEIHEATGKERAVAGGGRYDKLVESFGGPALPACGFGMGDVVLSLVLEDHQLKPNPEDLQPAPEVFVINTVGEELEDRLPRILFELRQAGIHARRSYKTTRNLGKLLKEAGQQQARFAAVMGAELVEQDVIILKDMQSGLQVEIDPSQLAKAVLQRLGRFGERGLEL